MVIPRVGSARAQKWDPGSNPGASAMPVWCKGCTPDCGSGRDGSIPSAGTTEGVRLDEGPALNAGSAATRCGFESHTFLMEG